MPKGQQHSRYYFFLSTLLIFFTILTIVLACGLSIYFVLKGMFSNPDDERPRFAENDGIELPRHQKFDEEDLGAKEDDENEKVDN